MKSPVHWLAIADLWSTPLVKKTQRTCCYCGQAIASLRPGRDVCGARVCRATRRRDQQREQAERLARLEDDYQARCKRASLDSAQVIASLGSDQQCAVLPVPHLPQRLTPLAAKRRENFAQHLREVMRAYRAAGTHTHAANGAAPVREDGMHAADQPLALLAAACAVCGGKCCQRGGDHAFVTEETIRCYVQRNPDADLERLEAEYLSTLPAQVVDDSCVFHTSTGCALPRALRSATCNGFVCYEFQRMELRLQQPAPNYWLLVSMTHDQTVRIHAVARGQEEEQ